MPELPEVETVKRGIEPYLTGRRIALARAFRADLRWPLPPNFADRLTGRRVAGLRRRSKYILIDLEAEPDRAEAETWLVHLGMSGRVLIEPADAAAAEVGRFVHDTGAGRRDAAADESTKTESEATGSKTAGSKTAGSKTAGSEAMGSRPAGLGPHDHVVITTDAARLIYNDPRRFGAMDLGRTDALDAHPWLARLGPEPLGNAFSGAHLTQRFHGKTASVKASLLDQRIVAGLGNIYVCEALWRAGVRPTRAAGSIAAKRIDSLVAAVRAVLLEAIDAGGSSLRDYRQADGELGYFQHAFAVYGRAGEPCRRDGCAGEVRRIVQTGRSSFYCPRCQR